MKLNQETLIYIRKNRGLTLRTLANSAGIALSTAHEMETSPSPNPRLETLTRIARALHTPLLNLLTREEGDL